MTERLIVLVKQVNTCGGKGPHFWVFYEGDKRKEIGMSLKTPDKIRSLQRKLYIKAKEKGATRCPREAPGIFQT